jgi:hypothetical protein
MLNYARRVRVFLTQPLAKKVAGLLVIAWILTSVGYFVFALHANDNKLVAALFVSWMGDVLFFSIVGAALTIISNLPAALHPYEERANILFQGRGGSQVDYAKSVLSKLGNFSERTREVITIHDEGTRFRLVSNSDHTVKNLIEDVISTYRFSISDPEQQAGPVKWRPKIISFSADGIEVIPDGPWEYSVKVGGANAKQIKIVREFWLANGEHCAHSPARFTKRFSLLVINQSTSAVSLKFADPEPCDVVLEPLSSQEVVELQDIKPPQLAYAFIISRLAGA